MTHGFCWSKTNNNSQVRHFESVVCDHKIAEISHFIFPPFCRLNFKFCFFIFLFFCSPSLPDLCGGFWDPMLRDYINLIKMKSGNCCTFWLLWKITVIILQMSKKKKDWTHRLVATWSVLGSWRSRISTMDSEHVSYTVKIDWRLSVHWNHCSGKTVWHYHVTTTLLLSHHNYHITTDKILLTCCYYHITTRGIFI